MANTVTVKPLRTFAMGDDLKTRHSKPFGVPSDIAFQLRESGLVSYVGDKTKHAEKPSKTEPKAADADPLAPLRAEYERLTDQKPHHLWKEDRLRSEIEKAKAD